MVRNLHQTFGPIQVDVESVKSGERHDVGQSRDQDRAKFSDAHKRNLHDLHTVLIHFCIHLDDSSCGE